MATLGRAGEALYRAILKAQIVIAKTVPISMDFFYGYERIHGISPYFLLIKLYELITKFRNYQEIKTRIFVVRMYIWYN